MLAVPEMLFAVASEDVAGDSNLPGVHSWAVVNYVSSVVVGHAAAEDVAPMAADIVAALANYTEELEMKLETYGFQVMVFQYLLKFREGI